MDLEIKAAKDFLDLFRGIGKTRGLLQNIVDFCEEQSLFRKDFKVVVIVESKDVINFFKKGLSYYQNNVEFLTMPTILYALSNMPDMNEKCSIRSLLFRLKPGMNFEKVFIDSGCFESLCLIQLEKLSKILKIVGGTE